MYLPNDIEFANCVNRRRRSSWPTMATASLLLAPCRKLNVNRYKFLAILVFFWGWHLDPLAAKDKDVIYSGQFSAFAPNAGGQQAFSLRRATNDSEWTLFANNYLMTGPVPLSGILYSLRYPLCEKYCFVQAYLEAGVGISTAGPTMEVLWGTTLLWLLRIDFATQFYVLPERVIAWSYPLWIGISLPL